MKVNNPIPRNGLFATKTLAEIQEYVEALPTEAKATAYLIMMMTLNASHVLAQAELERMADVIERV
jgi:hypothetical protein